MACVSEIVVAGGGVGGLAFGIAARRVGLGVTVLERAPVLTEVGSGVVLAPNGMKALAALGEQVAASVRAGGLVSGQRGGPAHKSAFLAPDGRVLASLSFDGSEQRWGAPLVSLLRARLQDALLRHATERGVQIRTGCAVQGYEERPDRVVVTLGSGETVEGELLVGADGLRSAVRRQLLADGEPLYRGYSAVRGVGPAPEAYPDGFVAYGRGLILFTSGISRGQLYWVASITAPPGVWPAKDAQAAHRDLLGLLEGWRADLKAVVSRADPAACVLTDIYDREPVLGRTGSTRWHRGRVVLLGDAAHPMAYTLGQGANTTLEDAVVLAHCLAGEGSLEQALARYVEARGPRTAAIVRQSRMMGNIGQVRNPLAVWLRDRMMGLMMRLGDPDKQNAEIFGWQPPSLGQ